jgi:hypothetical protein
LQIWWQLCHLSTDSQALTLMLVTQLQKQDLHLYTWMTWRSWRITFLYIYLIWSHFEKNAFKIK